METLRTARRGVDPEDYKWFGEKVLTKLKTAHEEVEWLLSRGYKISPVIELVGGRYQLSSRQRLALQRGTASKVQREKREGSELFLYDLEGSKLFIDGFNLIITLEVALSGGVLILGNDGALRDLAGLRGTYSIIDKTDKAIDLIGESFKYLNIAEAVFYLDSPVSNSGRLKSAIIEKSRNWNTKVEVELVPNADPILYKAEKVVTSDSAILDECESWFNLSKFIVRTYIKDAWIVDFISMNPTEKTH